MLKNKITAEVVKGSFQTLGIILREMFAPPNRREKVTLVFKYTSERSTSEYTSGEDEMSEPFSESN